MATGNVQQLWEEEARMHRSQNQGGTATGGQQWLERIVQLGKGRNRESAGEERLKEKRTGPGKKRMGTKE